MNTKIVKEYLDNQKIKVVEKYDLSNHTISYSKDIKQYREIKTISGDEEIVRAYILAKLVNELGYKPENIEIEKEYDIGRPKTNKPRIDLILRDSQGNAFLYCRV